MATDNHAPIPTDQEAAAVKVTDRSINRRIGEGGFVVFNWWECELRPGAFYVLQDGDNPYFVFVRRYQAAPPRFEPDSTDPFPTLYDLDRLAVLGRVIHFITEAPRFRKGQAA